MRGFLYLHGCRVLTPHPGRFLEPGRVLVELGAEIDAQDFVRSHVNSVPCVRLTPFARRMGIRRLHAQHRMAMWMPSMFCSN